ncbi:MAG: hypothetical protein A2W18_03575 [Candidatus Muproteobacteria bacterium RBG_16_60_9]|uniref:Uncharacterized protein n=1 Tax=Candidatus Muproteobacteria bacterium RBG_16_60_9 TaxID=1817755 RepID=A0A1F6VK90_9PROT|nr:MAG: hypothetical protein A2W18_03575 [Candidatus Muproteobacteria bacterium RBG_16_60_9]
MNRLTGTLLIAAVLALAGCGGSGGGGDGARTTDSVSLATKMINEATSEECPTQEHCVRWPVESLATVSQPDDAKTLDL